MSIDGIDTYQDRVMVDVKTVKDGIQVVFADGLMGVIPLADIPEIGEESNFKGLEFPDPYQIIVYNTKGEATDIPWDFARHYCDPSFQARAEEEAARGRRIFAERLRNLREAAGVTQERLAAETGLSLPTIVGIESGDESPRYDTIVTLAKGLRVPPERLLVSSSQ